MQAVGDGPHVYFFAICREPVADFVVGEPPFPRLVVGQRLPVAVLVDNENAAAGTHDAAKFGGCTAR